MSPRICLALAALFMCLCPLIANAQASRIKGYAVQVAALSSQRSAERLAQGLSARGIPAYCVGGVSFGAGAAPIHRVRVGNFLTILSANTYAEKLLGSGLLGSYAIAAYESPSKAGSISDGKVQTFAQKQSGKRFMPEVIDVIAAIGSRGWLLLSSESIKLTAKEGNSELSRELDKLSAVLNSRGWSLNNNIAKVLASPAPINNASLSSWNIANARLAPPPSRESSSPSNAPTFEVAREDIIPGSSTSVGSPISRSRIFDSGPRLQGSIEMRGGRLYMTLRNADPEKGFSGVARISLSDDNKQEDVTPIKFTIPPDQEASFPVNEATLTDGAWILMVYDQNGAARLIRGASLGPPKTPAQAPANSTASVDLNSSQQTPPSYVTGIYDTTTTWTQPQAPPQVQNIESQDSQVTEAVNTQTGAVDPGVAGSTSQTPQVETGPGQVAATLRQIAITRENVTLELVLSAQNAIKNVTVTLRAGDFQDVRQTFIPTSQGSVPFLVPVTFASAGIFYEIKDEAQRVLASGNSDLRSLGR